ncbi:error-prone DNA polymerase [Noviherbaspirillum saxi]|uniref:Error-prone DNA polymerase n=1 Tax=Noviherbaspirillum saxi TaxID=2320863 RepID=A0A3A3FQC7_9BURK|nr:error-prone DNA polymerase [Noviherbaspirillum saxi]RJF98427.1 error-prone DNA polymerase [Noviherbaspirillum saxi]
MSLPDLPAYAELQCVSNFTFLRGASHPEELVIRAAKLGYAALALTDECSVAGVVRAHTEAKQCGLHLIIGSQLRLVNEDGSPAFSLILLAQNREGYGNLAELITLARTRAEKGTYRLTPSDFVTPEQNYVHLRGMPDCLAILVPAYGIAPELLATQVKWMRDVFSARAWIALTLLHHPRDDQHGALVMETARQYSLPIVATGDVCMHVRSRKPLQDTLTATRIGKPIHQCGYDLAPNAEQHLRSRLRLANIYPEAALAATLDIAGKCKFSLDELRYEYPDELVPHGVTPAAYLSSEAYSGARVRFPEGMPASVKKQLDHELQLISEMRYEAYFLTVYDIVRYARSVHILCQGRGSAANSVVCYCLGITEVDPSRSTLLFERFISRERNEPPDIDVDFEHQRREEVMQYIYSKYGRLRAALTAVVISYKPRSVLRDVGKALGVDPGIVDRVAKSHRWWDGKTGLADRFAECGMPPDSPLALQWGEIAEKLMRFPRHLSQHPGGFVISRGKLSRLVPIENAAMKNRSVVQWDKDDIDALGLLKVDVLALGMLSMIRRALRLIGELRGRAFELQHIPKEDPATYDMICKADTVGVFQIESRAQMTMLPRLRPKEFYDLVIQVAIVRPGPIQGGMVHPYLRRRQGLEPVTYPSEKIRHALERTLGVAIFQEQVMQIAILAAEFTPGEADQLRRAMAAWRRKGDIGKFKQKLIDGMTKNGYKPEFIDAIVRQIHGFAEYGFPESHAASFALLAYASSWIKCHEPAAFLAALLNSQPMGFYSPSQLVQDARRHKIDVRAVDIHHSNWEATLEPAVQESDGKQPAVRLGFNMVRGLSQETGNRIEKARALKPFDNMADLAARAELTRRDLQLLAKANVLEPLVGHRRNALWQAVASEPDKDLLRETSMQEEPVELVAPSEGDNIVADYYSLGLTLGRHPLALLRPALTAKRFLPAEVLHTFADRQLARGCGIVTVRQRPQTANGTMFVTIEDETGLINVIVWPGLIERYRKELLASQLLGVYGIWQSESNVHHLVASRLVDLSHMLGRLSTHSRDFS